MNNNYLQHYGVLGQKWGVRRFENSDGTLTAEGKKRYSKKVNSKWFEQTIKGGKDKPPVSPAEKVISESGKVVDRSSNIARALFDAKRGSNKEDLSKYSNDDLQKAINRMNLERQYRSLKDSDTTKGEKYAMATLSIVGDLLAIGVSAATIYSITKNTKG